MSMTEKQVPWYFTPAVVIVAGCLVAIVNFGVRSSFGLFTAPISEAHAWPREIFSFGLALQNLLWGIATPIAGALADRYGSARVLMVGAIFYAVGTVVMAVAEAPSCSTLALASSSALVSPCPPSALSWQRWAGSCHRKSVPGPLASQPPLAPSASSYSHLSARP